MREWKFVDTKYGIVVLPTFNPRCIWHNTSLLLHDFYVSYNSQEFYHCDIHMKCPKCNWFVTFGVPISEEEYKKIRTSELCGKVIIKEAPEIAKLQNINDKEVKERLKKLGYW